MNEDIFLSLCRCQRGTNLIIQKKNIFLNKSNTWNRNFDCFNDLEKNNKSSS